MTNFNAGFCLGELIGCTLEESLACGCASSGYYVREAGSPTAGELAAFLSELPDPENWRKKKPRDWRLWFRKTIVTISRLQIKYSHGGSGQRLPDLFQQWGSEKGAKKEAS